MAKVKDEWTIDKEEVKNKMNEMTPTSTGVLCPRRNLTGSCVVCEKIKTFWDEPDNTPKKIAYRKYKTMGSFFFNAVKPEDPETILTIEVGWKSGSTIMDSMNDDEKDWSNLHHPKANVGYELKIKKTKRDGYPFYDTYKGELFDWDVSDEVLKNIPDISRDALSKNVISGELQRSNNYFHVKNLEMEQTITLRVLPNPKKKRVPPIEFLFRHWGGVTKEQVEGTEAFDPLRDIVDPAKDKSSGDVNKSIMDSGFDGASNKTPVCFGSTEHYDPSDDDCSKDCPYFEKCGKAIAKAA